MIYLDYQATTPLAPQAFEAMLPWLRDSHANPHSAHRPGRAAKAIVEVAREQVAALLPTGGHVAFTSGATEALNWAIKGTTGPIVTLATEHAAVLDTVAAEAQRGRAVTVLPVGADGLVDLEAAAAAIRPGTGLVAAMLVNNEIGVMQPLDTLAAMAREAGALFLCDAVQGYGRVALPQADLIALSAHKVHGPKGIGALWVREGVALEPLLHGGGQEPGRSGTLSPALCAGFGAAAALMTAERPSDEAHVARLWWVAAERLGIAAPLPAREGSGVGFIPAIRLAEGGRFSIAWPPPTPDPSLAGRGDWIVNGSTEHRYRGNVNVRREGLDVNRLMSDCREIAFSAGSACASGSGRPSHVLRAIGLTDAEARSSIRLGFGRYTTEDELAQALDAIVAAADRQ